MKVTYVMTRLSTSTMQLNYSQSTGQKKVTQIGPIVDLYRDGAINPMML